LRYREDYEAAGIPMLPVVKGERAALREMVAYSVAVFAATLVLPLVSDVGAIYVVAAVALGVAFVGQAVRLLRSTSPERAIRFFMFSNTYLAALFAAVALDTLVRAA
jgi:protoheme IX farnesyltransferase